MVVDSAVTPPWRFGSTMAYDPGGARLMLFGGWATGSGWALLDSLGPRRAGWNRGVYDEPRSVLVFPVFEGPDAGRLLYFGGYSGPPMRMSQELRFLDGAGWRKWDP
jgi:hypothetical protein